MVKVYLLLGSVWFVLVIVWFLIRKKFRLGWLKWTLWAWFILLFFELSALVGLRLVSGYWLFNEEYNINAALFDPDPYLVGVPKKNVSITAWGKVYSHNSMGWRNDEFEKYKTKSRIVVVGGSTVYGIGVTDHETWPYFLDSLLGDSIEVLNFGIPGHSTVEHLNLLSFFVPVYDPDLVLVQCGLNDLRNMHVDNLKADYANFHQPTLFGTLGFCYLNGLPRIALLRFAILVMQKLGWYPVCDYHNAHFSGRVSAETDSLALGYFREHVNEIKLLEKGAGVPVVFVPHVASKTLLEKGDYSWWVPYLDKSAILNNIGIYNNVLQSVADSSSVFYCSNILDRKWPDSLFADPTHLTATGNLLFARKVYEFLKTTAH